MNFCFFSERTFESWDYSTPLDIGIGGSETSHVEMAQRLARRGHQVWSFAPLNKATPLQDPVGAQWSDCSFFGRTHSGFAKRGSKVAVIYRAPHVVDQVPEGVPAWLICQDVEYRTMTEERGRRFSRIVALCDEHAAHLKNRYPYLSEKVCVSSNGIRSELIRQRIEAQKRGEIPARNPKRLIYASSPDRGLSNLLTIFSRLKELVPDVELHVYYGFNNLEKIVEKSKGSRFSNEIQLRNRKLVARMEALGVINHGRIGQRAMIDEWLQSGIWCHPSEFTETSCITCMDAQANGAIPVTTPIWAINENVQYGVMVEGYAEHDSLTQSRYVLELLSLVNDQERQQTIREQMQPWALQTFDWENFVTQWETWAAIDLGISHTPGVLPQTVTVRADGPQILNHRHIEGRRALGTIARMGGIMALPVPFVDAWDDLHDFSEDALCDKGEYIFRDRARMGLHDRARNELAGRMRGDWLLMLDTDSIVEPDFAARMVALTEKHRVDVLTAPYPYKSTPSVPVLYLWNELTQRHEVIVDWDESQELFEFSGGGAGCLLIRAAVFERIKAELGEEPFSIIPPYGEDNSFFMRLRKLGIKAWCATRIECGHLDYETRMLTDRNLNREKVFFADRETTGIAFAGDDRIRKGA